MSRLSYVALGPEHAELTFAALLDERIYTHIPWRPPASVEALHGRFTQLAAGSGDPNERWLNWLAFAPPEGRPVGWFQATVYPGDVVRGPHPGERRADVAWIVFPPEWRRGYALEGVGWMFDQLRELHGVDRVVAEVDTRNVASIALAGRLGFSLERTVPTDEGQDHVFHRSLAP